MTGISATPTHSTPRDNPQATGVLETGAGQKALNNLFNDNQQPADLDLFISEAKRGDKESIEVIANLALRDDETGKAAAKALLEIQSGTQQIAREHAENIAYQIYEVASSGKGKEPDFITSIAKQFESATPLYTLANSKHQQLHNGQPISINTPASSETSGHSVARPAASTPRADIPEEKKGVILERKQVRQGSEWRAHYTKDRQSGEEKVTLESKEPVKERDAKYTNDNRKSSTPSSAQLKDDQSGIKGWLHWLLGRTPTKEWRAQYTKGSQSSGEKVTLEPKEPVRERDAKYSNVNLKSSTPSSAQLKDDQSGIKGWLNWLLGRTPAKEWSAQYTKNAPSAEGTVKFMTEDKKTL